MRPCIFDFNCFIAGQHIYNSIWIPILQEELTRKREPSDCHVKYAIKVIKEDKTVGQIPELFLNTCGLILLSGSSMKVHVTKKQQNQN